MAKMTLQMHPDSGETTLIAPVPVSDTSANPGNPPGPAQPQRDLRGLGQPQSPATPQAPAGEQPLILGKFKSQADLEKAYAELEKKLGAPKPETPAQPAEGEKPTESPAGTPPGSLSEADITRYNQEVLSQGGLSAGSLDEIVKKTGLPRKTVEDYVTMMKASQTATQDRLLGEVGGSEALATMTAWAKDGFDEIEAREFNAALASGDEARTRVQLRYLKAKYEANNSVPPQRTMAGGGTGTAPTVDPYASWAQVEAAMSDPRYKEDPAYRQHVYTRLAAGNPSY